MPIKPMVKTNRSVNVYVSYDCVPYYFRGINHGIYHDERFSDRFVSSQKKPRVLSLVCEENSRLITIIGRCSANLMTLFNRSGLLLYLCLRYADIVLKVAIYRRF